MEKLIVQCSGGNGCKDRYFDEHSDQCEACRQDAKAAIDELNQP